MIADIIFERTFQYLLARDSKLCAACSGYFLRYFLVACKCKVRPCIEPRDLKGDISIHRFGIVHVLARLNDQAIATGVGIATQVDITLLLDVKNVKAFQPLTMSWPTASVCHASGNPARWLWINTLMFGRL